MTDFDERSGIIPSKAPWGQWWQTMEEVFIEIDVREGTRSKDIGCVIKPRNIKVVVHGNVVLDGELPTIVHSDEAVWTLEDKKLLRICLVKADKSAANCWDSLLVGQFKTDELTYDQMEKKMTLQRFQSENPGFDFSGADITGNYHGGGPQMPS